MPYLNCDLYSSRHADLLQALKDRKFPATGEWAPVATAARQLVVEDGFDVTKYDVCVSLRKKLDAARKKGSNPAATVAAAAAVKVPVPGAGVVAGADIKRIAAMEMVRHLWLLKKSGSHRVWVLSLPNSYRDWPEADLAGKDFDAISGRLNDKSSHFGVRDRKHLSSATQEGLKWVMKAMIVAADPGQAKHMAIIKRWFADANSSNDDMIAAAATLSEGLKKIAACIQSTFLLFVDMPKDRGDATRARVNAFVFSDEKIDVVYVEAAFFSNADLFKDLKNWTRIVVHELSHREAKTKDHRYRHHAKGLKPDAGDANFSATKALDNADSWAMFCMDCAGRMSKGDYALVKV
jgi:hypothetical protein